VKYPARKGGIDGWHVLLFVAISARLTTFVVIRTPPIAIRVIDMQGFQKPHVAETEHAKLVGLRHRALELLLPEIIRHHSSFLVGVRS